jgi:REP element-mobilizing transposase RayT
MSVKYKHSDTYSMYFCTFTCYQWMPLFEMTNSYDLVYKWFNYLQQEKISNVIAYVIMPNHLHCILYFANQGFDLNKIISNAKRFMAYDIVKRLQDMGRQDVLEKLSAGLTAREIKKGHKHRVFEESLDAKAIYSEKFLMQKLSYIHQNPVSGKWNLASRNIEYNHSTASF